LPPTVMGHAAAALTAGGLATLLLAGWVTDRVGPRLGLVIGGVVTALGLAAGAVAGRPLAIYTAAALAGAGTAFWRVTQAPTLMRLTSPGQRSRIFSWNVGLIIGSGAIGVAVAGSVPGWVGHALGVSPLAALRVALLFGAGGTALSLLLFLLLRVPSVGVADVPPAAAVKIGTPEASIAPARHSGVLWFVLLVGGWMLAPALVAPFFNLYFLKQFSLGVDRIGLIFGLVHGLWAVLVLGSGELATRSGATRVLAAWLILVGPALLLLPAAGVGLALALYFAQGLAQPAANPLIDQLLMERSAPERRGMVSGWRNAAADGSAIAGASLGGWVLGTGSFPTLFLVAGAVGVGAAVAALAGLRGVTSS